MDLDEIQEMRSHFSGEAKFPVGTSELPRKSLCNNSREHGYKRQPASANGGFNSLLVTYIHTR